MDKSMNIKKVGGTSYQSLFELKNMFRKIPFLFWPFEFGNCRMERKNQQNIEYLKNEKSFLEEINTIFHNVLKCILLTKYKK